MTSKTENKTEIVYIVYYCEIDSNGNIKSRTKKKECKTIEEAQEHVNKYNSNDKSKKKKYIDAIIISTPKNIQIGTKFEIKNSNNEWILYGTINRITENFYHYDKPDGIAALYGNFFEIDSFMDKIANEVIRVVIDD